MIGFSLNSFDKRSERSFAANSIQGVQALGFAILLVFCWSSELNALVIGRARLRVVGLSVSDSCIYLACRLERGPAHYGNSELFWLRSSDGARTFELEERPDKLPRKHAVGAAVGRFAFELLGSAQLRCSEDQGRTWRVVDHGPALEKAANEILERDIAPLIPEKSSAWDLVYWTTVAVYLSVCAIVVGDRRAGAAWLASALFLGSSGWALSTVSSIRWIFLELLIPPGHIVHRAWQLGCQVSSVICLLFVMILFAPATGKLFRLGRSRTPLWTWWISIGTCFWVLWAVFLLVATASIFLSLV